MSDPLADLFPDGDYRFHLTLRRAEPREFFSPRDSTGTLLTERAKWLAADPARYAALQPEGAPLLEELGGLLPAWGVRVPPPARSIHDLGAQLEPDLLLLSPDATGAFRLRGGALCFPTGWALEEKLGHTLEFIHGVVPGLNPALGASIHQFLSKIRPGVAFLRDNWGIAATDTLNLHPVRQIAAPESPVEMHWLWLRVEHQALVALPAAGGIAFGIRISLHRLDRLAGTETGRRLGRALITMSSQLAAYKRIEAVREEIARRL